MPNRQSIPMGRIAEFRPEHPERTSIRPGKSWDSDYEIRVWPSRGAMLTACRMTHGPLGCSIMKPWTDTRWHEAHVRAARETSV